MSAFSLAVDWMRTLYDISLIFFTVIGIVTALITAVALFLIMKQIGKVRGLITEPAQKARAIAVRTEETAALVSMNIVAPTVAYYSLRAGVSTAWNAWSRQFRRRPEPPVVYRSSAAPVPAPQSPEADARRALAEKKGRR